MPSMPLILATISLLLITSFVIVSFLFESNATYLSILAKPKKKYALHHKYNSEIPNSLPLWGSYCPGNYFALKQRTPPPNLLTGIMWTTRELLSRRRIRHMVAQDELKHFSWVRHDGTGFGRQELEDEDGKVAIKAAFAVNTFAAKNNASWSWLQKYDVSPTSESLFMLYFGADCDGLLEESACLKQAGITHFRLIERQPPALTSAVRSVVIAGKSVSSGFFCLEVNLYAKSTAKGMASNFIKKTLIHLTPWMYQGRASNSLTGVHRLQIS